MMSNHVTIRIQKKAIVLSCSYSYHSNIPYVDGVGFRSAVISQLLGYDMPNRGININIYIIYIYIYISNNQSPGAESDLISM